MKRALMLILLVLAGVAALNSRVDAVKTCPCSDDCWCHRPLLRHFRWFFPFGHDIP